MKENTIEIKAKQALCGEITIPGDKSVSHRSIMFASLANAPVLVHNFLPAADCLSTVGVMKALGANIEFKSETELIVCGNGLKGLKEPTGLLDAGNSGTTLRLMMGILAGQNMYAVFVGDESLSKRPMARVIKPLKAMGASLFGRDDNKYLPITVLPKEELKGINYNMPMASAQVKSAILLAGLFAKGETTITEPYKSRDHTEKMLTSFGVPLRIKENTVTITPVEKFQPPKEIYVPGDISSAAFWLVAGAIMPNSKIVIKNVGLNETRTGIIEVLQLMGAKIEINNIKTDVEPRGDITVQSSQLKGIDIGGAIIPRIIDEIPIITVAAMFAEGRTKITDAEELRVKETDRIAAVYEEFSKISPQISIFKDGLTVEGRKADTTYDYAECDSWGDHRIAMSLAILGTASKGVKIKNSDCVRISYPDFFATLNKL